MNNRKHVLLGAPLIVATCGGCADHPEPGRAAVERYGCVSCHTIPSVRGSDALVGPPLYRIGGRTYIAGAMINTPENMTLWLKIPQAIRPGSPMPNLNLSDEDARDIAAFLESLR